MSEIDEDFGRYLDSLAAPVEPEWVMGWVARRRRRRAVTVAGLGLLVAITAGAVGYELHSTPSGRDRVGTNSHSSPTVATTTTTVAVAPTTSAAPGPPQVKPPESTPPPEPTTAPPPTGPVPATYPVAEPGDVGALTTVSNQAMTVGVPVDITVTLVNTRDHGVYLGAFGQGFVVDAQQPGGQESSIVVDFGAGQTADGIELAPHAAVTASVTWVPRTVESGTLRLAGEHDGTPDALELTQTPTAFTVAAAPETTTTTSAPINP